mmetsp:Transcript_7731/g.8982  ORF Transcript_7731/g.8982 Transcript_7731/m.8982 type:complete len:258 (-) Transcript_7731:950-1723(-)
MEKLDTEPSSSPTSYEVRFGNLSGTSFLVSSLIASLVSSFLFSSSFSCSCLSLSFFNKASFASSSRLLNSACFCSSNPASSRYEIISSSISNGFVCSLPTILSNDMLELGLSSTNSLLFCMDWLITLSDGCDIVLDFAPLSNASSRYEIRSSSTIEGFDSSLPIILAKDMSDFGTSTAGLLIFGMEWLVTSFENGPVLSDVPILSVANASSPLSNIILSRIVAFSNSEFSNICFASSINPTISLGITLLFPFSFSAA